MEIHIPVLKILFCFASVGIVAMAIKFLFFSEEAELLAEQREKVVDLPTGVKVPSETSNYLGWEVDLDIPIYLPESVRSRHVHIIGATGSGKTESVILNLIDQDAHNDSPIVIVDAKGDQSFVNFLRKHPKAKEKLLVFDMAKKEHSVRYDPLASGTPVEAVARLFSSMTWSEEFYKLRARETLLRLAEIQVESKQRITLQWLKEALASAGSLVSFLGSSIKISENEYSQLAGLVAQVNQLCYGNLGELISGASTEREIRFSDVIKQGKIIYFRLPALVDPVTTATVGRLIIADLAYYSASVQDGIHEKRFTPVFLDEFSSLVCPSFIELIGKSRSAGIALHFSHQSLANLKAAGESFASEISDNCSTKIVLRVYDPDTTETVAKTFGTHNTTKETRQVITGPFGTDESTGAMSVRDVKEFRAEPDVLKSLPTGWGFVLMNHAMRPNGRSGDVFKIKFPLPPSYNSQTQEETN